MKISNRFTLTRVVLAPIFLFIYFFPIWTGLFASVSAYIMIPLLAFVEFTDFLDGYYARKNNEVSDFGKMFDPFADVILHLTTFACFMYSFNQEIKGYLPLIIFLLILYREFSQNFLRMVAAKKGTAIAARKGGKLKTVSYVVASFICLIPECATRIYLSNANTLKIISNIAQNYSTWKTAAFVMFEICLALSYLSFLDYVISFKSILKDN